MPILHAIDLVPVDRIEQMIRDHGDHFLKRCFTPGELAYVEGKRRAAEHLAGRFAAKEAVLKALGTGWSGGIAWTDVEVAHEAGGRPIVLLHAEAARVAESLRVVSWTLSITHAGGFACASAIAEREAD